MGVGNTAPLERPHQIIEEAVPGPEILAAPGAPHGGEVVQRTVDPDAHAAAIVATEARKRCLRGHDQLPTTHFKLLGSS